MMQEPLGVVNGWRILGAWLPAATLVAMVLVAGILDPGGARAAGAAPGPAPAGAWTADPALAGRAAEAEKRLLERYGETERARIERGVAQVLRYWRPQDGEAGALGRFLEEEFLPAGPLRDATFERLEYALERMGGYFVSLGRDLRRGVDLEIGPILPIDRQLADYDPGAHLLDDMYATRIAFTVLLNFPLTTLEERLRLGGSWTRRDWAEARLVQRFASRVPAAVSQRINAAYVAADTYISGYNIHMHHLLTEEGDRPFAPGLRLISHWGLRDELKAGYSDPRGLVKQRLIQSVMERIVTQEIPAAVIDNPRLDWMPSTNRVSVSTVQESGAATAGEAAARPDREADERYRIWRDVYLASREADPFEPDHPTLIDRRFDVDREIPEQEVRALLESVLDSPLGAKVARLIRGRLGRPLEPFDIWYAGFKTRSRYGEEELDALTRKRYPDENAFAADIPRILRDLGFSEERASFYAQHIVVDPSRGAGHAMGAARRDDAAHLRTRVGSTGMDYKGYNIAVHELGHNIEQVTSLNLIDHTLLQGVPNTAFTEAMAFVFQARDLALLGLGGDDPAPRDLRALEDFWATREIAGVALLDMTAWRWLYDHPGAGAAEFRQAVLEIARRLWNRHYAALLGRRYVPLLAIYSHLVSSGLYTPDYPLGHLIAFQVEEHFRKHGGLGPEFERLCRLGALTPDAWMRQAVGGPLSPEPLLQAAERALQRIGG